MNGSVDSVKISVENKVAICGFVTADKSNIGFVKHENIDIQDSEIGIYTTSELIKLLSVMEDEVKVKIESTSGKAVNMKMAGGKTVMTYMLADLSIIDDAPQPTDLPEFEIELKITPEFVDSFLKAKAAIKDATVFAVISNGKTSKLVMNYSKDNVNNIAFAVDAVTEHVETDPICFSAGFMGEILSANKDAKVAKFEISKEGLAKVSFDTTGEYSAYYYLLQLAKK